MTLQEILDTKFWDNSVQNWLIALIVFLVVYFVLPFVKSYSIKIVEKTVNHTKTKINDLIIRMLKKIGKLFMFAIALFLALQFVKLPYEFERWIDFFVLAVVIYQVVRIINSMIGFGAEKLQEKEDETSGALDFASKLIKILVGVIAFLFLLQNLGVNVSSLLAGLGIGGIAVALALQTVLGDMFSSFSIYLDKPFKVGDLITTDTVSGTVKKIGIKTTRIKSVNGEEIVISNQDLTSSRIQNFARMRKRRDLFMISVDYSTKLDKLKKIPDLICKVAEGVEHIDVVDRVYFKEFGNLSLNFEVVYWVDTGDYNEFVEAKQEFNLKIFELFEKEEIVFAFPAKTVFVEKG